MVYWLTTLGISADIAKNIVDVINAGLTVTTILSLFSTVGLGAGLIATLKGIFKKKGAAAAIT